MTAVPKWESATSNLLKSFMYLVSGGGDAMRWTTPCCDEFQFFHYTSFQFNSNERDLTFLSSPSIQIYAIRSQNSWCCFILLVLYFFLVFYIWKAIKNVNKMHCLHIAFYLLYFFLLLQFRCQLVRGPQKEVVALYTVQNLAVFLFEFDVMMAKGKVHELLLPNLLWIS